MRRFAAAAFAAALVLMLVRVAAARQEPPPVPLDEYWALVGETLLVIEPLDGNSNPGEVRAALDPQAVRWEAVRQVQLADGATVPVDSSAIVSMLRADPPDLLAIKARLTALLEARDEWITAGDGSGASTDRSPMDTLRAVMAQPQFQWAETEQRPNPIQEWLDDLGRRIQEWLLSLIPDQVQAYLDLNSLFSIIGGLVLLVIIFFVLRGVLLSIVEDTELNPDDDALGEVITAEGALQRARDVSETGDYRTAVRFLYLSTLLFLEEHGMLRYDRSRTNREYLGSIRHKPELAAIFRDVVEVFDRVWYGYHTLDKDSFDHYAARVAEIRRQR